MASGDILKFSKDQLVKVSIIAMISSSTVDQGGSLLIKYLSFLLGLFVILYYKLKWRNSWRSLISFIYIIWPLISVSIGLLNGGSIGLAINNITPFIPGIIMLFLLDKSKISLAIDSLNYSILFMSIVTLTLYLIFFLVPSSIPPISNVLNSYHMGYFGIKAIEQTGFPGVYFKSALFFNFGFTCFLMRRQYIFSLITLFAIVLSFSKAAIAGSFFIVLIYTLRGIKGIERGNIIIKYYAITIIMILIIVFSIFIQTKYYNTFLLYFQNAFSGEAGTTQVRIGHFESIRNLFFFHPEYLLFGQGAGTEFFTKGFNLFVNNIELDHLNAIRKFGLIWSLPFYFLICSSIWLLWKHRYNTYAIAYFVTFILVGTNPLMINPLFIIITIIFYKITVPNQNDKCLYINI